ncbi:MAG: hypothetical protein HOA17_05285 [Candidatus Melainabacteria bacterium]|jgi:uncharacterized protein|nr:hypothetical protein [Candidatus Melainabacteria bacterium]
METNNLLRLWGIVANRSCLFFIFCSCGYLAGHENLTLMLLHLVITMTFGFDIFLKLGYDLGFHVGLGHICIGIVAFYHATATWVNKFIRVVKIPLAKPLLA